MECSQLTAGLVAAQCNKTASAGAQDEAILINFNDIDKVTSTVTDNVISKFALKKDKKGFSFMTYGKSYKTAGSSLTVGTYRNTFVHTVPLMVFVKNEEAKKFVNSIGTGARLVIILKNNEKGANGEVKYEVYGWDNGLSVKEIPATLEMADGLVYNITMTSEDAAQEGSLPKSLFDTDEATTDQMVASLVSPQAPSK